MERNDVVASVAGLADAAWKASAHEFTRLTAGETQFEIAVSLLQAAVTSQLPGVSLSAARLEAELGNAIRRAREAASEDMGHCVTMARHAGPWRKI